MAMRKENMDIRKKATRHPDTPNTEVPASSTAVEPPQSAPKCEVRCRMPNVFPRLVSSVASATRDWIAGQVTTTPRVLSAMEKAICGNVVEIPMLKVAIVQTIAPHAITWVLL
jgi:hypothetical protein